MTIIAIHDGPSSYCVGDVSRAGRISKIKKLEVNGHMAKIPAIDIYVATDKGDALWLHFILAPRQIIEFEIDPLGRV